MGYNFLVFLNFVFEKCKFPIRIGAINFRKIINDLFSVFVLEITSCCISIDA